MLRFLLDEHISREVASQAKAKRPSISAAPSNTSVSSFAAVSSASLTARATDAMCSRDATSGTTFIFASYLAKGASTTVTVSRPSGAVKRQTFAVARYE